MSEVLSRAQTYIQLEEAVKSFVNHSLKRDNDREKTNSQCKALTYASNQNLGQLAFKKQAFPASHQVHFEHSGLNNTPPTEAPHQRSFSPIKDQPWVSARNRSNMTMHFPE